MILAGEEMEFLQIDAAINQGNSGGPVFNMQGELIGIVSSILSKSGRFEGFGFAASISPAKKILLEGSPFWTGFEGIFINGGLAATFNVTSGAGVLVQRVVSNSVADKAGLRGGQIKATILGSEIWIGGDIILSIHNNICAAPHNFEDIKSQLDELAPGETINMKVLREGNIVELSMIFN